MTLFDCLRQKFTDAGFSVSPRGDVGAAAVCWYLQKAEHTLANWRSRRCGPRFVKIGGTIRYPLDAILQFELDRSS